jgi:neurotransmitter:Na+ symporter, NSS family
MCCIGVVVGFSNFWSFPVLMVKYGGLVFLSCYVFALAVFAVPLMVMQIALGRHSRKTLVATLVSFGSGTRFSLWKLCGLLLLTAATLTVVLYAVVAGMGMAYVFRAALGGFNIGGTAAVAEVLIDLQQDTERMLIWLTLFVIVVYVISLRGIHKGLGAAIQYFIPVMGVILVSLIIYSARIPGLSSSYEMLLTFHWEQLSWLGLLAAFKQAFFSLAIGTGVYLILGAYMPMGGHITRVAGLVAGVDMLVGVLAGVVIVPWLAAAKIPLDQGFSLIFYAVPLALSSLPLGQFFGAMLYVLLTLAAWSSAIILIEPAVAMVGELTKWKRVWASFLVHLVVWLLGALLVDSLAAESILNHHGVPLFSVVQLVVAAILIPVAAILLVFLLVFLLPPEKLAAGLGMRVGQGIFRWGYFSVRFLCFPLLLVIQIAVVFDLLLHSCQFESFQRAAVCAVAKSDELGVVRTDKAVLVKRSSSALQDNDTGGEDEDLPESGPEASTANSEAIP